MKMKPTLPTRLRVSRHFAGAEWYSLTLDMRQDPLILWKLGDEAFDGAANHSVLAHQNDRLSSEGRADFVHLLGADIVNRDNEDGLELVEQALKLVEVDSFGSRFAPHNSFDIELGCLRAN